VVIIDTTVWIDYLNGASTPETEWLDRELTRQRLGLTDLDFDPFEAQLGLRVVHP